MTTDARLTSSDANRFEPQTQQSERPVLVTGVPGWLGSALVRRLRALQRPVRCLVYREHWSVTDLDDHPELEGTQMVVGDVRNPDAMRRAVDGVETVFHLAGIRHPSRIRSFRQVNATGAEVLAAAAADAGVSRLVHVSSISVHGHNPSASHPFDETSPLAPFTPYARSKAASEAAVMAVRERTGLPTVILRPGPFYGPAQSASMYRLMQMIDRRTAPNVTRAAERSRFLRSFVHVENAVDALLAAETAPDADGRAYLIADERPYSTWELIGTIADALSTPLRTWDIPLGAARLCEAAGWLLPRATGWNPAALTMAGEMGRHVFCSIDRARTELGYQPKWDLNHGIREAAREFRAGVPGARVC